MNRKLVATAVLLALSNASLALHGVNNKLHYQDTPGFAVGNYDCSGTLVSPRVVITSASCIKHRDWFDKVGFILRRTGDIVQGEAFSFPGFSSDANERVHDIGVVVLERPYYPVYMGMGKGAEPIDILSYTAERELLKNDKGQITLYGNDNEGRYPLVLTYQNGYVSKDGFELARKFRYQSIVDYQKTEPERVCIDCIADEKQLFTDADFNRFLQNKKTIKDLDLELIMTAGVMSDYDDPLKISPVETGDQGGTVAYKQDNKLFFLGNISTKKHHVRAMSYWRWIVNIVSKHSPDDAMHIAKQVIDAKQWGDNDNIGEIGDLYIYKNTENGDIEYFRLTALVKEGGRYGFFPTDKSDNDCWEYLGTDLPKHNSTMLHKWKYRDQVDGKALVGDVYVYNNPRSKEVEYFRLIKLGEEGQEVGSHYGYLPTDKTDNYHWKYLGTDLDLISYED